MEQKSTIPLKSYMKQPEFNEEGVLYDSSCYFKQVEKASEYILNVTSQRPKVLVICGSGLSSICDHIENQESIKFQDIPNVPISSVVGHENLLVFGKIGGKSVVAMRGRVHYYEGYTMCKVTFLIRCLSLCGIKTMLVTSAVGGINPEFEAGDAMIIRDHINLPGLSGQNPLIGKNDERFGTRFPVMSGCYDKLLCCLFKECAKKLGFEEKIRQGVMSIVSGPYYETPAEIRFLRLIGADTVGMSVGPEVISARHCGMHIMGVNLVTNKCTGIQLEHEIVPIDEQGKIRLDSLHDEVIRVAQESSQRLSQIMAMLIQNLPQKYI